MQSPAEIRHALFRDLFLSERARRESIRSSIGTPVAAISFAVFAFSSLAVEFDAARWNRTSSIVIMLLAVGSIAALLAAIWQVVMVEWLFVYHEPPSLNDLLDAEDHARAVRPDAVARQSLDHLTASYAVAYEQYLRGNTLSARSRTRALRFVLLSLLLLALAFLLLPIHLAA